jgi:tRNA-2-methylthio-N6-dimethylallyladenosine synthase
MNRKYSVEDFEKIIDKVRRIKPDIAIGTDIIVGFPGETEKQFDNTLKFYEKIQFDIAFISRYSVRDGTAAAKLVDNVPIAEKKLRWQELQALMEKIVLEKNQRYIGQTVEVLIDKAEDYFEGNSREMKRVKFARNGSEKLGDLVSVRITEAREWQLLGEVI